MDVNFFLNIITVSMLFTMVLYHLVLHFGRNGITGEKYSIYLSGFAFMAIIHTIQAYVPDKFNIEFAGRRVIFLTIVVILTIMAVNYVKLFFQIKKRKILFTISFAILYLVLASTVISIFNEDFFKKNLYFPLILAVLLAHLLICIVTIHEFIKRKLYKSMYNTLSLIGFVLLLEGGGIERLPFLRGNFVIMGVSVFFLALALVVKFNEELRELVVLRTNLLQKVDDQTRELANEKEQHRKYFKTWAHEAKTPLFIIGNALEAIKKNSGITEDTKTIDRQLARLNKDTRNYLKGNRTAEYYNENTLFDLSRLFREKVLLYKELASIKKIKLIEETEPGLYLQGDSRAVETIIDNIMDNALKYTDIGSVEVCLKKKDTECEMTIKDTGAGIPEADRPHIFKQFYRSGDAGKDGAGMGLFIVRDLVKSFNGSINVNSREGNGTQFIITLPLYFPSERELSELTYTKPAEPVIRDEPEPVAEIKEYNIDKKTLFIVDDNQDILNYFYTVFSVDYNCFLFNSGNSLLKAMPTLPRPSLILSDYMMNDGSGAELLKAIRKICEKIPFMLITAQARDEVKKQCLNAGATDYIEKSLTIDELKARIKNFIVITENTGSLINLQDVKPDEFAARVKDQSEFYNLSPREKEYLVLYLTEKENREIAKAMDISKDTVRRYKQNVTGKLGVSDRHRILQLFGYTG